MKYSPSRTQGLFCSLSQQISIMKSSREICESGAVRDLQVSRGEVLEQLLSRDRSANRLQDVSGARSRSPAPSAAWPDRSPVHRIPCASDKNSAAIWPHPGMPPESHFPAPSIFQSDEAASQSASG